MKDLIVTIALLILGVIIAGLILSQTGLLGAARDLFLRQISAFAQ